MKTRYQVWKQHTTENDFAEVIRGPHILHSEHGAREEALQEIKKVEEVGGMCQTFAWIREKEPQEQMTDEP